MIKKSVIWVCGLVFAAALASPAIADQSIGYQFYFKEGVRSFKDHDDQKALRCFKIAQIYDPHDKKLKPYLEILQKRGVVLRIIPSKLPPERSIGFQYYFNGGLEAFHHFDDQKAIRYFEIALVFYPGSRESLRYLDILSHRHGLSLPVVVKPPLEVAPATVSQFQPYVSSIQPPPMLQPSPSLANSQPVHITQQKLKQTVIEISLAQLTTPAHLKPTLMIDLYSSVILDGKNIKRILVVDEGFIVIKALGTDRLEIDALRIGTTFLHIWDDYGRHTLFVQVVFPKYINTSSILSSNGVEHSQPFTATYTNDWTTYYSGKNISDLKRQSYDFNQTLSINGETPYGFFDTSGSYTDFNSISEFDTYTIGLSQIPLEGTSNFDIRGFDALRYLSPLTMPGTRLRGTFADVDLMDNILGLSVSHGQEQEPLGFISMGANQFNDSYIDAVKLTLFPTSETDRYSFNFATAYGQDRPQYLTDHVYSLEGQHKFNEFTTLNAEEASDGSHDSSLASLKWQNTVFRTALNFRNIDKDYSTISTLPANQGETGVAWTTDTEYKNISESTFVETYQDHLYSNPDDPNALNYDANGHLRVDIAKNLWTDSDFNFVDTQGELSPQKSLGLNQRISRSFGIWNSLKGTAFGGVGYQNSNSSDTDISSYDREDVIAGIQLPLTAHISSYANYEYDWLNQSGSDGGNSNPSVVNAGLEYQKQFTPKFSFNSQVDYRDELGVTALNNSFLSGEESVIFTTGVVYNPTQDVSIYVDGDASKVLSHVGDPSYDDFEVHLGVRIVFGGTAYWDPLGTVSGIVFKDRNQDGKYVAGDTGIPGVKVKVGDKEVVTDKYGRYSVQIRAKGVTVYPLLDTVPGGLIFSTLQSLNVKVFQGRQSHADFGLISQTGIYGIVFVDKIGTGVPNDGDRFVGKVRIILDGSIIQKSDSHGAFYFRKVSPGKHVIAIDINSLAINMLPLVRMKNNIEVAEGTNYVFNIPVQIKQSEGDQN